MGGKIDAFVCGVGSGGTLGGVGGFLRSNNPDVALVLADPIGSILAPLTRGEHVKPGSWMVEGIGEDFLPPVSAVAAGFFVRRLARARAAVVFLRGFFRSSPRGARGR